MKTLLTAAALAIAFLAPAAEARVATKHQGSHTSATVKAKTAKTGKKAVKSKHKKPAQKSSRKASL